MSTATAPPPPRSDRAELGIVAKSGRRTRIVDGLLKAMTGDDIFRTLDYRKKSESVITNYMHQPLKRGLVEIHRQLTPGQKESTLKRKAEESLMWEGDVKTTINHVRFLGAQHRPDFKVVIDGLSIGVEVKRGESGSGIREGIGQSLVYVASEDFNFVVYLFIDTSKDKKILKSLQNDREQAFVRSLWDGFNVRLQVI